MPLSAAPGPAAAAPPAPLAGGEGGWLCAGGAAARAAAADSRTAAPTAADTAVSETAQRRREARGPVSSPEAHSSSVSSPLGFSSCAAAGRGASSAGATSAAAAWVTAESDEDTSRRPSGEVARSSSISVISLSSRFPAAPPPSPPPATSAPPAPASCAGAVARAAVNKYPARNSRDTALRHASQNARPSSEITCVATAPVRVSGRTGGARERQQAPPTGPHLVEHHRQRLPQRVALRVCTQPAEAPAGGAVGLLLSCRKERCN